MCTVRALCAHPLPLSCCVHHSTLGRLWAWQSPTAFPGIRFCSSSLRAMSAAVMFQGTIWTALILDFNRLFEYCLVSQQKGANTKQDSGNGPPLLVAARPFLSDAQGQPRPYLPGGGIPYKHRLVHEAAGNFKKPDQRAFMNQTPYLSETVRNMPTRSVFRDRRDCCLVCAR